MIEYNLSPSIHPLSIWDSGSPDGMGSIGFLRSSFHGRMCMLAGEYLSCLSIALPLTSRVGESCEVIFSLQCSIRMIVTFKTIERLSIFV